MRMHDGVVLDNEPLQTGLIQLHNVEPRVQPAESR